MINKSHIIIYVDDQERSTNFYSKVLNQEPILNVPGMTEFLLTENTILGIMPSTGIKKLLHDRIDILQPSERFVKAELYLVVDNLEKYLSRTIKVNAKVLSETSDRDWGHKVVYLLDPDNYVIAFAELL